MYHDIPKTPPRRLRCRNHKTPFFFWLGPYRQPIPEPGWSHRSIQQPGISPADASGLHLPADATLARVHSYLRAQEPVPVQWRHGQSVFSWGSQGMKSPGISLISPKEVALKIDFPRFIYLLALIRFSKRSLFSFLVSLPCLIIDDRSILSPEKLC